MPRNCTIAVWLGLVSFRMLTNSVVANSCAPRVSIGDQGVGISAIEDSSCMSGGLGCFSDGTCRFCQNWPSPQSNHLLKCTSETVSTQVPVSTAPPVSATPAPTTSLPVTLSPSTTPPAATFAECTAIVKNSRMTGISFVTDKTCDVTRPTAIGCSALTSCRLCRLTKNENNQFLINCAVLQAANLPPIRRTLLQEISNATVNPKSKHFTDTLFFCVGGMALVVVILGLAHFTICRRDNSEANCAVDGNGLATKITTNEDSRLKL